MSRRVLVLGLLVSACGGGGGGNPPLNMAPVANAGADRSVAEGLEATLDGSQSSDADGSIVSYAWTQTEGPAVTLLDASAARARFTAPLVEAPTTLTFTLDVVDDAGATSTDSVVLTIDEVDTDPDAFSFVDVEDAEADAVVVSAPTTLTGFNAPLAISVVGGSYSIDSEDEADFTTAPGTVEVTDVIRLRTTAAASGSTAVTLTVGTVSATWTVSTAVPEGTPEAELFFPLGHGEYPNDTIRVRGQASVAVGRTIADVIVLHETGIVSATVDPDGTFRAEVPLQHGDNELVVQVNDDMDGTNPSAATVHVRRQHPIRAVTAIAWDTNRSRVVAMDNIYDPGYWRKSATLVGLDPVTRATTVISGPTRGTGPTWTGVHDIVIVGDTAYLHDVGVHTVFAVNLVSGNRSVVSSMSVGTGPLGNTRKLAYDAVRNRLLMTAQGAAGSVIAISLPSGNRTLVAGTGTGSGEEMLSAGQIIVNGDYAYVYDSSDFHVVRIDLVSLARTVISANGDGKGPNFGFSGGTSLMGGFAFGADGKLYASDYYADALVSIDVATGNRAIVSSSAVGTGTAIASGEEILYRPGVGDVLLADVDTGRILSIALATGNREIVHESAPFPGYGNGLYMATAVTMSPDGRYAYVAEYAAGRILRVEMATAAVVRITQNGAGHSGPELMYPSQIFFDAANDRLLVSDYGGLYAVDLTNGTRTLLSGMRGTSAGSGPAFSTVTSFDFDESTGTAYVADFLFSGMYQPHFYSVPVSTGARTMIYDGSTMASPRVWRPTGVVRDGTRNLLFAVDEVADVIWRLDLAGTLPGTPTMFSSGDDPADPMDAVVASGPDFEYPGMLAHDPARNELYLYDDVHMRLLGIDDETGNRTVRAAHDVGRGIELGIPGTYTPLFGSTGSENPFDMIAIARGPTPATLIAASNMHNSVLVLDVETGDRVRIIP